MLVLAIGLVAGTIITFGKDTADSAISSVSNLVAGDKIEIPNNPEWQTDLKVVGSNVVPTESSKDSEPATITDTVSVSLMSNYLTLKQSGTLDQTKAQQLVDSTVNYLDQLGEPKIESSKLNVVADKGKLSAIEYGARLGAIIKKNKPSSVTNELDIINQAVSTRNAEKIKELDNVIVVYKTLELELTAMPVPTTFVKAHTDLVNGVKGMRLGLEQIKLIFADPFKGLFGVKVYQESGTAFIQSLRATISYLVQKNIVYKQGSGGYYLLHGI